MAHRAKSNRERHREHEKTDELMVQRMDEILYPPTDQNKLSQLHENDTVDLVW